MRSSLPWLAIALFLHTVPSQGQGLLRDTTVSMVIASVSYAYQFPGGDLSERFGANSNVGVSFLRKTTNNVLLGAEGSFLFGNKVIEPGALSNVINSQGQVVDQEGLMADVFLYERGWNVFAVAGKIFPIVGPNPNSGIMVKAGAGYMRHKILVQTQKNVVPQLEGEYLDGYDRLSAGPAAMGYVGYQYLGNRGRVNFHIGLELMAGFTKSLRAYNFDTEQFNKPDRTDILSGLRAGWSMPLYRRLDDRFRY